MEFAKTLKEAGKKHAKKNKGGNSRGKSWFDNPFSIYQIIDDDKSGEISEQEFMDYVMSEQSDSMFRKLLISGIINDPQLINDPHPINDPQPQRFKRNSVVHTSLFSSVDSSLVLKNNGQQRVTRRGSTMNALSGGKSRKRMSYTPGTSRDVRSAAAALMRVFGTAGTTRNRHDLYISLTSGEYIEHVHTLP